MTPYNLTKEDESRIKNCDFYQQAKTVIRSLEDYKAVNVGEVYSVYWTADDGKRRYVSSHGSSEKNRYLIIQKDDGFIFGKRLNSYGTTGKDVVCLTIRFPSPSYGFELDEEQAESIIFCEEDSFDPFKKGKVLKKQKDKARVVNKKHVIKIEDPKKAYDLIKTLNVGQSLWDTMTLNGESPVEWEIVDILTEDPDKTPVRDWQNNVVGYGKTTVHQDHNVHNFNKVISVNLKAKGGMPKGRRWHSTTKTITFKDFKSTYRHWFLSKPVTVENE